MKVVVGSRNPAKIKGVKRAYVKVFGEVDIVGVSVSSMVSQQPLSLEETFIGALNRAREALRRVKDREHGVGVEAGWLNIYGIWLDIQITVIVDRNGRIGVGFSPAFPLPTYAVKRVLKENVEMEVVFEEVSGIRRIGEKEGAIGFLTKSMVSREDLTYYATLMALIPFMPWNERHYRT